MRPGFDGFLEECRLLQLIYSSNERISRRQASHSARSVHKACLGNHLQYFGNYLSERLSIQNAKTTQSSHDHPEAQLVPSHDLIPHRLELIHIPVCRNISTGEVLALLLRQPDKKTSTQANIVVQY
jgi:hypothetical protein